MHEDDVRAVDGAGPGVLDSAAVGQFYVARVKMREVKMRELKIREVPETVLTACLSVLAFDEEA